MGLENLKSIFTEDGFNMDTFLGRESGNQNVIGLTNKFIGPKPQFPNYVTLDPND